jgi:hypothetical protein
MRNSGRETLSWVGAASTGKTIGTRRDETTAEKSGAPSAGLREPRPFGNSGQSAPRPARSVGQAESGSSGLPRLAANRALA